MKTTLQIFAAFFLLVFLTGPGQAAEQAVSAAIPTRESLISFWEEKTLNDPEVRRFEKTSEKGVYKFETTFFPYKGRLKLLNAAITKTSDSIYEGFYTGIVEVELLDAPQDFFRKYSASYGAWTSQNYFYYDVKQSVWFPSSEWSAHFSAGENGVSSCPLRGIGDIFLLIFLIAIAGALVVFVKKQNKKIWDNHAKALAEQQRGLKIAEESLQNQKEQIKLLKEISRALKEKQS